MSAHVNHAEHHDGWPHNQWHPIYTSIREWLENEAPPPCDDAAKERYRPRFRMIRRRRV